eukprot:jgi/Ulvmu1/11756/UM008_0170.1
MLLLRVHRGALFNTSSVLSTYVRSVPVCRNRSAATSAMAGDVDARADAVLKYWFDEEYASWPQGRISDDWFPKWFGKSDDRDTEIKKEFEESVVAMRTGTYDSWLAHPQQCLAGIILMDQFTRNIYRGSAEMYSMDDKARQWAAQLASNPAFFEIHPAQRMFIWLPFMHGETMADQEQCLDLINSTVEQCNADLGQDHPLTKMIKENVGFAERHKTIIAEYGRFPHRNVLLGRESTEKETAGLADGTIEGF